jgi:hypothetical protein
MTGLPEILGCSMSRPTIAFFNEGNRRCLRFSSGTLVNFIGILYFCIRNFSEPEESYEGVKMAKNHYSTKPKRRNRSGKRKDTRRIAANMAKIKDLERNSGRNE